MSTLAAAPPPAPTAEPFRLRWAVLAIVLVAEVMDLVDGTIVNVAAPSIRADLGGGSSALQWMGAAYTLAFAVLLITGARLGDLFGLGWRAIFLVNVPLGLAGLIGSLRVMPRTAGAPGTGLDPVGAVLATVASFALIYPLV